MIQIGLGPVFIHIQFGQQKNVLLHFHKTNQMQIYAFTYTHCICIRGYIDLYISLFEGVDDAKSLAAAEMMAPVAERYMADRKVDGDLPEISFFYEGDEVSHLGLLHHRARGCWGPILPRVPRNSKGVLGTCSTPGPHGQQGGAGDLLYPRSPRTARGC